MVLWEITVATAYFLGLKRTYRLALKIQRRIAKRPKIRQFLHRKTRQAFDVALSVHKNIQQRDLEVGRSLGNRILRWLDRMKPSAQIRRPQDHVPHSTTSNTDKVKKLSDSSHLKTPKNTQTPNNRESDRHLFTSTKNIWPKSFPTVSMMIQPPRAAGNLTQYRHLSISEASLIRQTGYMRGGFNNVIRKDIMQWMARK